MSDSLHRPDSAGEIGVVLNPKAGRGKASELVPLVVETLHDLGFPHHVHVTTAPGDATSVARRFATEGKRRLIVVGGDGTINEAVNGLIDAGHPVVVGIVPVSRGSDFARTLGVPRALPAALARAALGPARRIDVGLAELADGARRHFVNIAGVGFDAVVADRANRSRVPGATLPYLTAIASTLSSFRNVEAEVEADGVGSVERACAILVANGRYFGGGMRIVPDASPSDGALDLAILGDLTKPDLIRTLPKVFWGGHVGHRKYHHRTINHARISTRDDALVEVDGEVIGHAPVQFSIRPGALLVAG